MIGLFDNGADQTAEFFRRDAPGGQFRILRRAANVGGLVEAGLSPGGGDAADPHPEGTQFGVETVAELGETGLGRGVDAPRRPGVKSADAGDVDDDAPAAFGHDAGITAASEDDSGQVGPDGAENVFVGLFRDRHDSAAESGVVDQYVEVGNLADHAIPVRAGGGVRRNGVNIELLCGGFEFLRGASGDPDLCSGVLQNFRNAATVPVGSSGDQNFRTFDFHVNLSY